MTTNSLRRWARGMPCWAAVSASPLVVTLVLTSISFAAGPALAQTYSETVLYSFTGGADGGQPDVGGLILDAAGTLYGATISGGNLTSACGGKFGGCGVVFRLDTKGNETVLHAFTGKADGAAPDAGLIRDTAGNLYGTTSRGGDLSQCFRNGCGVVFKLNTSGKETVLYTFKGGADGGSPTAGLIRDNGGNLYGTTINGGDLNMCSGTGCGVVFKLDKNRTETVLYTFTGGVDGSLPFAGLIRDNGGNLYGTTTQGGLGTGVVFKQDSLGKEKVLYAFHAVADGATPYAGVIRDDSGNLYGTTTSGGDFNNPCVLGGCGVVFKLDRTGNETVFYAFTGGVDGYFPLAGLIRDTAGNLYGTTTGGGASGYGVVFKLDTSGNETVLHSFAGGSDGTDPDAGLVRDAAGNLYGTTHLGGASGQGTVFKLTP